MKRIIRLTEGDLHRVIKESVKKVINESNRHNKRYNRRFIKESDDITAKLDAMYAKQDFSKLYLDPRLYKHDVWIDGWYGREDGVTYEFIECEFGNYSIEDYLESHDLDDIRILGGDDYQGYSGDDAAYHIVNDGYLGKDEDGIKKYFKRH